MSSKSAKRFLGILQKEIANLVCHILNAGPGSKGLWMLWAACSHAAQCPRLFLRDAVEKSFAAEVEFLVHERGGGTERIVKLVYGQHGILQVMTQNDRRAVAAGDVNATGGADG